MSYSEPSYRFAECARCGREVSNNPDYPCFCTYDGIKEILAHYFEYSDENFDSHETDLYVLPRSEEEQLSLIKFLKFDLKNNNFQVCKSTVKGQSWYGKTFIDIPFALIDEKIAKRRESKNV